VDQYDDCRSECEIRCFSRYTALLRTHRLLPRVNRTKSGIRDYTEEDCRWVEFIKCMRNPGLPIEVLIEYVALFQQGSETIEARKEVLLEQRKQLARKLEDMQKTLDRLDYECRLTSGGVACTRRVQLHLKFSRI